MVVRHLNKAAANNPLYQGGGSIGIIGAARMAFVVGKDPQDENRRVLAYTKNNLATPPSSRMFGLEEAESGSVRVKWLGRSEVSAKDILATTQDQEHADARSEAVEFLKEVFADGPVPAKQVVEEADDSGIAEKTLRRVKKLLDVIVYREGTAGEKRGSGRWLWKLPVVELVEDDVQGGHTTLEQNVGHLEQVKGTQTKKSRIDKPNVQDGHVVTSRWSGVQGGHRSSLLEDGHLERSNPVHVQDGHLDHLEECGHGYTGGKGCYLCDPNHPYRLKEGVKA